MSKITNIFPTKEEINKEAESHDHAMTSLSEGIWVPIGFRKGVEWTINKIKENLKNNEE